MADPAQQIPFPAEASRGLLWDGSGLGERSIVATTNGPMQVQDLQAGTELSSPGGSWRAARVERHVFTAGSLRWSGHPPPVRIEAGALGGGLPRQELLLGAKQDVMLAGGCWPARRLVTGTTIRFQPPGAPAVLFRLWPGPDATLTTLVADGVTCGAAPAMARLPDADMAGLSQLRLRLQRQAGQAPGALLGHLDRVSHAGLVGWAVDSSTKLSPVCLEVRIEGVHAGTLIADRFRPDLASPGGTLPNHGFTWRPPVALDRSRSLLLSLHRVGDAEMLPGCPVLLPALATSADLLERAMQALPADGRALAEQIVAGLAARAAR